MRESSDSEVSSQALLLRPLPWEHNRAPAGKASRGITWPFAHGAPAVRGVVPGIVGAHAACWPLICSPFPSRILKRGMRRVVEGTESQRSGAPSSTVPAWCCLPRCPISQCSGLTGANRVATQYFCDRNELHDLIQSFRRTNDTASPVSHVLERTRESARKQRRGSAAKVQWAQKDWIRVANILDFSGEPPSSSFVKTPALTAAVERVEGRVTKELELSGLGRNAGTPRGAQADGLLGLLHARQRSERTLVADAETPRAPRSVERGLRATRRATSPSGAPARSPQEDTSGSSSTPASSGAFSEELERAGALVRQLSDVHEQILGARDLLSPLPVRAGSAEPGPPPAVVLPSPGRGRPHPAPPASGVAPATAVLDSGQGSAAHRRSSVLPPPGTVAEMRRRLEAAQPAPATGLSRVLPQATHISWQGPAARVESALPPTRLGAHGSAWTPVPSRDPRGERTPEAASPAPGPREAGAHGAFPQVPMSALQLAAVAAELEASVEEHDAREDVLLAMEEAALRDYEQNSCAETAAALEDVFSARDAFEADRAALVHVAEEIRNAVAEQMISLAQPPSSPMNDAEEAASRTSPSEDIVPDGAPVRHTEEVIPPSSHMDDAEEVASRTSPIEDIVPDGAPVRHTEDVIGPVAERSTPREEGSVGGSAEASLILPADSPQMGTCDNVSTGREAQFPRDQPEPGLIACEGVESGQVVQERSAFQQGVVSKLQDEKISSSEPYDSQGQLSPEIEASSHQDQMVLHADPLVDHPDLLADDAARLEHALHQQSLRRKELLELEQKLEETAAQEGRRDREKLLKAIRTLREDIHGGHAEIMTLQARMHADAVHESASQVQAPQSSKEDTTSDAMPSITVTSMRQMRSGPTSHEQEYECESVSEAALESEAEIATTRHQSPQMIQAIAAEYFSTWQVAEIPRSAGRVDSSSDTDEVEAISHVEAEEAGAQEAVAQEAEAVARESPDSPSVRRLAKRFEQRDHKPEEKVLRHSESELGSSALSDAPFGIVESAPMPEQPSPTPKPDSNKSSSPKLPIELKTTPHIHHLENFQTETVKQLAELAVELEQSALVRAPAHDMIIVGALITGTECYPQPCPLQLLHVPECPK